MTDNALLSDEDIPSVASEINDHKEDVSGWIAEVKTLTVPASHKNVSERLVRDCQTFIADLDALQEPSSADLGDLGDRKNSLEIQYHNLTQEIQ